MIWLKSFCCGIHNFVIEVILKLCSNTRELKTTVRYIISGVCYRIYIATFSPFSYM